MTDSPDPKDAIRLAQQAMQRITELEAEVQDLRDENAELRQRVCELEANEQHDTEYQHMDRAEKVARVKQHLVEKAGQQGGKAQLHYQGVRWEVFCGEPSPGHCYTLMEQAAQDRGFDYGTDADGQKVVKVNTAKINREKRQDVLSRANKEVEA